MPWLWRKAQHLAQMVDFDIAIRLSVSEIRVF